MRNLLSQVLRYSVQDYLTDATSVFSFNGVPYIVGAGSNPGPNEKPSDEFVSFIRSIYKQNGVAFAVSNLRQMIFAQARFQWQRMNNGRPGDLFGTNELGILENPWPNGTTGDLLARMEQDVTNAGNSYIVNEGARLRRLRPDWVTIVLSAPANEAVASDVVGYMYQPGGPVSKATPKLYQVDEIAHYAPIPDPELQYKGMSWMTPIIREVVADKAETDHKVMFFENSATPQLAITLPESVEKEAFQEFVEAAEAKHAGLRNAHRTLYLGGGADVTVVGKDLQQLDFSVTQGAGETRIAVAGGVHPVLLGFSEGLKGSALNSGNYQSAKRAFVDRTMRYLWQQACSSLEPIVQKPAVGRRGQPMRLWYDDRNIPYLSDDQSDIASVQSTQATAIGALISAGYEADSVIQAIVNRDWTLLQHTGLFSVQLQPPSDGMDPKGDLDTDDTMPGGAGDMPDGTDTPQ